MSAAHRCCYEEVHSVFSSGEAFKSEDFTLQMRMMDAMLTALERSLVGFTYAAPTSHYSFWR